MKKLLSVLVVLVMCAAGSQATVIVSDDFTGSTLDTAKWTNQSSGGTVTVAGDQLVVQASGDQLGQVRSNSAGTILNATESLVLSSTGMSMNDYSLSSSFGLSDASGLNQIRVGTMWGGARYFGVEVIANGVSQKTFLRGADYFSGEWTITWSADKITAVGRNGELTFATTSGWVLPAMGTQIAVLAYAGYQSGWTSLVDVKLETIPEPATITLFGLAGLLLRRRVA